MKQANKEHHEAFDLQEYMTKGVERVVTDAIEGERLYGSVCCGKQGCFRKEKKS